MNDSAQFLGKLQYLKQQLINLLSNFKKFPWESNTTMLLA
jgi:hypothetical protein